MLDFLPPPVSIFPPALGSLGARRTCGGSGDARWVVYPRNARRTAPGAPCTMQRIGLVSIGFQISKAEEEWCEKWREMHSAALFSLGSSNGDV